MTHSTRAREQARVLLVDESPFVLQGLQAILAKNRRIRIVATAHSPAEAMAAVQAYQPNVVVSEVQLGRASGIELCRTIRESYPQIGVLFFTSNDDKHLLRSAIIAGAQGYLLKMASGEAVVKGIEIVSEGKAIVDPRLTQQVIAWVRHQVEDSPRQRLNTCSKEDLRILALITAGKNNREIAQRLKITSGVLATRLRGLYKRLNISRRSEAAKYLLEWEKENVGQVVRFD